MNSSTCRINRLSRTPMHKTSRKKTKRMTLILLAAQRAVGQVTHIHTAVAVTHKAGTGAPVRCDLEVRLARVANPFQVDHHLHDFHRA